MTAEDPQARRSRLARAFHHALVPQFLERWYPRVVDEEFGGFYSDLALDFTVAPVQRKETVTQTRHLWTASKAAELLPNDPRYARVAAHGFAYLRDVMWDEVHGGFYPRVYARSPDGVWPGSRQRAAPGRWSALRRRLPRNQFTRRLAGALRPNRRAAPPMVKTAYGHAFALFGLAAYHRLGVEPQALELAQRTFHWLDERTHDPRHGGYASYFDRDGTPLPAGPNGEAPRDFDSILHLLEAFTELLAVWPDPLLRERLEELVDLACQRLIAPRGTGWTRFEEDWTPRRLTHEERAARDFTNERISFGHDIETAALLIEAADALGLGANAAPHALAHRMVAHSLDHGWDPEHGGLFDTGYYFDDDGPCEVVDTTKLFWVQAEALNTLSLMAVRYPDDPRDYLQWLSALWDYCDRYMLDHARGGWFARGLDDLPESAQPGKAEAWRGTYHVSRALMNGAARLADAHT